MKKPVKKKPVKAPVHMTGDQLRGALDQIGFTQMGFARFIDVDGSTVRRWLSGALRVPKLVSLLVLALLTIKPEELETWNEEPLTPKETADVRIQKPNRG